MDESYFYLPRAFLPPANYVAITKDQLKTDTDHPELNSTEFFNWSLSYEPPKDFLPVFSLIEHSGEFFVLGTNDFTSPVFDGNLIGTKNFDEIVKKATGDILYMSQQKATVTGLKFLDQFLVSAVDSCKTYLKNLNFSF
jgi:hypothetical protein